jgi:hypothetical protein
VKEEGPEMATSSIVYAEYVRLGDTTEKLMNSSFDDFKLFAVIGAILGLKPLADSLSGGPVRSTYLFVGFLGLLLVVAIIAFRDTLKQSLMVYMSNHLKRYEKVIKQHVPVAAEGNLFQAYAEFDEWVKRRHIKLAIIFNIFFLLPVVIIPTFILWHAEPDGPVYARLYLGISIIIYVIHFFVSKVYLGRPLEAASRSE